ncbi:MAG TPA: hypothetical protein VL295_07850 [Gemmatimonadales bacterium]|jgi:Spy/CpxP family protein refolding chaperone|nr:hypothetical protein [Gemmatimonadales bacterium]
MMRSLLWSTLVLFAAPLAAQVAPTDTTVPRLRQRIEARFREVAREELGLTDEQANRVWAIQTQQFERGKQIELEEKRLNQLLSAQLRPGIAADPVQATRALDSLGGLRLAQGRMFGDEQRELAAFLTPVQRAQLYRLRARINARVAEMIRERDDRPGRRRP